MSYSVIRFYRDDKHPDHKKVIKTGLSLEEVQTYCKRSDSHEIDDTGHAVWFDGYHKE